MAFTKPWTPSSSSTGKLLQQYHENEGGLLISRVNAAHKTGSRNRWCTLRIVDPPEDLDGQAYRYTAENREDVRSLVSRCSTEVIQVHSWGFSAFGRVVGKSQLIEHTWSPTDLQRVLLVDNVNGEWAEYYPEKNRDPGTHDVFDEFDVEVQVLE